MIEVLVGWVFLPLGLLRRDSSSYSVCLAANTVVLILPEAIASSIKDKFQVPAKHLLSGTRTMLVPAPDKDAKARWDYR